MATTEPLTGARIPTQSDAPAGGTQISNAISDLAKSVVPRFDTTAARDAAYQTAGATLTDGMVCYVGRREYVYLSGWQPMARWRGSVTSYPSDAIVGDACYHQTLKCTMRMLPTATWRQESITNVNNDADRLSFLSAVAQAGVTLYDGHMVYQEDADRLYQYNGGGTLIPVGGKWLLETIAPWGEAAGFFGNTPQQLTTLTVPDPGFPYRIAGTVHCLMGSSQAGSRWDMWIRVTGNNGLAFDLDHVIAPTEIKNFQRCDIMPTDQIITGPCTVIVEARRAYGTQLGQIDPPGSDRRLAINRIPA